MPAAGITRTVDAIWRIESVKLIAGLPRMVRDIGPPRTCAGRAWEYHLLSPVRGDLFEKLGRFAKCARGIRARNRAHAEYVCANAL